VIKMKTIIFVSILLLIGAAGAVVELSGTDPAVFDQPKMAKDGVDGNAPMLTSSQTAFLAEGTEMNTRLPGKKVLLLGGRVGYERDDGIFFTPAELAEVLSNSTNSTMGQ
jgi:hypothetical protein